MEGMTRRRWMAAAAAPLLARGQANRPPNIVLIVADDLGYSDLGCYGHRLNRTPHLDRLAAGGIRFTDFYVSWPACTPSRSSILTGRYPQRNGLFDMIRNNEVNWKHQFTEEEYAVSPEMALGLDLREITIAQVLKEAGYTTGVAGKWDSGRARRFLPLQRGFDFFYGFANTGIDYYTHERYGVPSMFRGNEPIKESGHATDLFLRESLRCINEAGSRPFFLYVPFNAPHGASTFDRDARQAPEEYLKKFPGDPRAQYRAWVTHMDDAVGEILAALRKRGLEDNTLVLFTSDNGGSARDSNAPLRGGKAQMFEGGVRVPLVARWPGRIPAGKVSHVFATTLEFFPTFAKIAGGTLPAGVHLDGVDFLHTLRGDPAPVRNGMFWQRRGDKAARTGNWKWVASERGGGLFDLSTDIGEEKDLSRERPAELARVKGAWQRWRKEMDAAEPRGPFRDY